MKHKCNNCVYKENCSEATPCEDFYPLDGDLLTDDVVERIVEDGRSEFESGVSISMSSIIDLCNHANKIIYLK